MYIPSKLVKFEMKIIMLSDISISRIPSGISYVGVVQKPCDMTEKRNRVKENKQQVTGKKGR